MAPREFDIVIFGATGFTGFFAVRELVITLANNAQYNFTWAIAGRNESKMNETLDKVGKELSKDLSKVAKIIADTDDRPSLKAMAERARLVMNLVGPFIFRGMPVVEACVEAGTHHIDISGEPNYIENAQLNYYQQALEKGTIIISTCGWDSIPADMGVEFMRQNFDGRLHSVETFMKTIPGPRGYRGNFGTLQSAIYGYAKAKELGALRRRLFAEVFTEKPPRSRLPLARKHLFTNPQINGWCLEFPGSDRSVVQRTQTYNYQHYKEPAVQIQTYFVVKNFFYVIGIGVIAAIFGLLSSFSAGRSVLESYPELCTFGAFSKNGPSREQIDGTRFHLTILGKGWARKELKDGHEDEEPATEPTETMKVTVAGPDPGYIATSSFLVQSGITILLEENAIPKGVITPGTAFRNTKLVERLATRDIKFAVVKN